MTTTMAETNGAHHDHLDSDDHQPDAVGGDIETNGQATKKSRKRAKVDHDLTAENDSTHVAIERTLMTDVEQWGSVAFPHMTRPELTAFLIRFALASDRITAMVHPDPAALAQESMASR